MAFRLLNKNIAFPALYPKVERRLPTVKDKGWTKVGGFTLRENLDFMPQPGLQENVCQCEANIIYMCGAATGGKTFAGIMMQLYRVDRKGSSGAMISTRLQDSKKAVPSSVTTNWSWEHTPVANTIPRTIPPLRGDSGVAYSA